MTRFTAATALPVVSLLASQAAAWGNLGHETVGYVASNFVSAKTKQWAQDILGDDSEDYLGAVATWADSFKYTDEGEFSSGLHYIDAEDDPPNSCNVDFDRDCPEDGCVVSAIANYTSRVQDTSLDSEQTSQALKFIVHFIGDIHQPLHDEAAEIGGNTINVTFDGEETNLHSYAQSWAANLTGSIKNGKYSTASKKWLANIDIDDAQAGAMIMASDANSHVCSTVMPDGVEGIEGDELYPEYYNKSIGVIEMMIAKAGYRLAAWLDMIATGETKLTRTFDATSSPAPPLRWRTRLSSTMARAVS
ncbi:hypothetical protein RGQ29_032287 [Quercus rubra]|uniref:Aspergillus nuclease S1 n=1 Tax=Quercus rubra TaxID=3512 RepID=A0AAN7DU34_QUERU|nr:hypothetical protein RGQ29_032287 [Quercus rubra]